MYPTGVIPAPCMGTVRDSGRTILYGLQMSFERNER